MDKQELYNIALNTVNHIKLRNYGEAGQVACALETCGGSIFTGVCVDLPCSIGFCAEQAAVAEMLKHNETAIKRIVAVYKDGSVLPPCGKCREFIVQIDDRNIMAQVVLPDMKEVPLEALLPQRWDKHGA